MRILNVVGARPNLMKMAPIMEACRANQDVEALLVHTGQHYDDNMSDLFFRELAMPEPDLNLDIGSVIVFSKHNSDPITLLVNNVVVGTGKTIKVGDHFGLHLRSYSPEKVVHSLF